MQQKEAYLIKGAATDGATPPVRHRIATAVEIRIMDIVGVVKRLARQLGRKD